MDTATYIFIVGIVLILICTVLITYSVLIKRKLKQSDVSDIVTELQTQLQQEQAKVSALNERIMSLSHTEGALEDVKIQLQQERENVSVLESRIQTLNQVQNRLEDAEAEICQKDKQIRELEEKASQLKLEVEKLEDDLAEIEDEKTRLRRQNAILEQENQSLEIKKSKLQQSYEELENNYRDTIYALQIKDQTLAFVDEILGAQLSSDGQELHAAVDKLADFVCDELITEIRTLVPDNSGAERSYFDRIHSWAILSKKTWIGDKTTIAFVGEFSAGKTSIVNRILSQDQPNQTQLPVDTKATTAIPTYISGGRESQCQFYTPDNKLKKISEQSFRKVTKELLENIRGVGSLISYFVMKYNNPNLNNISILDTPGFNSLDEEDTKRTIGVINECDALFWVFDVNMGALGSEVISRMLDIVKQHLTRPLYIVINKVDTKSKSETDSVEKEILKELNKHQITAKDIIRFSSNRTMHPLSLIMAPIEKVTHNGTKDQVLDEIEELLKSLESHFAIEINQLQATYNTKKQSREKITYNYGKLYRNITTQCQDASGLPQFISRIIMSDYYKLTVADYNQLSSILEGLINSNERMNELFNNNGEIVAEMERIYPKLRELQQKEIQTKQLLEKFRFLRKNYQSAFEKTKIGAKQQKKH